VRFKYINLKSNSQEVIRQIAWLLLCKNFQMTEGRAAYCFQLERYPRHYNNVKGQIRKRNMPVYGRQVRFVLWCYLLYLCSL